MKHVTYIFGAGASCEVLPLNREIPDRLRERINEISKYEYLLEEDEYFRKVNLIADLEWLWEGSKNHASVDTFAKKLYIRQKWKELKRLRLALSVFFVCEQMGKMPDKRYDSFFASLLTTSIDSLPSHIKILNWNYDYQFELSFMGFTDTESVIDMQSHLHCIEKYRDYFTPIHENFELYKLNGDISLRENDSGSATFPFIANFRNSLNSETFREVLNNWDVQKQKGGEFCSNISFAWEKSNGGLLNYAAHRLINTEILVVIGYSFPFFNREIDRTLLNSMKNLQKVYLQAPDANDLEERFEAVETRERIELVKRFDKNQFLIPSEL
jgi:hypothetical protein